MGMVVQDSSNQQILISGGQDGCLKRYSLGRQSRFIGSQSTGSITTPEVSVIASYKGVFCLSVTSTQISEWPSMLIATRKSSCLKLLTDYPEQAVGFISEPGSFVAGFHSSDFLLWSYADEFEFARWECGGRNRAHTFRISSSSNLWRFVYHRDGQIKTLTNLNSNAPVAR